MTKKRTKQAHVHMFSFACKRSEHMRRAVLKPSALTVPLQCPYSALTVPYSKTHSALIFFFEENCRTRPFDFALKNIRALCVFPQGTVRAL